MPGSRNAIALAAWVLLGAIVVLALAPPDGEPGLNYDEAFLGQQARDFLEPDRETSHPPSERSTRIAGRRFPLRNAAYLGALKPQLLIPAFALFGSDLHTLRLATLGTALLALLFALLWARRLLGTGAALLGAAFVAFDPSFVFFGKCEWGPFTTLLLCRCVGLYALTAGWQDRRGWLVAAGALAMGLGVYARADFVLIGVAAFVGLVAVRGRPLWREIRERPGTVATAGVALVVGSLPMLLSTLDLLAVESGIADRGGLGYRMQVMWSSLDGSYYYRVIELGGLFERLFEGGAPAGVFGWALVAAVPIAGLLALRGARDDDAPALTALGFLAVTTAVLTAAMLALPGAVRAHHMLNGMPFGHFLLAGVLVQLARVPGPLASRRLAAAAVALAVVGANLWVVAETRALIRETGGRGRYSDALDRFAADFAADPENVAVSLDWGFHETLQFLGSGNALYEPIWAIPQLLARGQAWGHRGDARHHYLVFAPRYDLFQLGPLFMPVARTQGADRVQIQEHRDREGELVFYSVRFLGPHELHFDGRFRLRFPE